jgi:hypothetical protein
MVGLTISDVSGARSRCSHICSRLAQQNMKGGKMAQRGW